jgi:hypothetical protein
MGIGRVIAKWYVFLGFFGFFFGGMKCSKIDWLHNFVKILKITEF